MPSPWAYHQRTAGSQGAVAPSDVITSPLFDRGDNWTRKKGEPCPRSPGSRSRSGQETFGSHFPDTLVYKTNCSIANAMEHGLLQKVAWNFPKKKEKASRAVLKKASECDHSGGRLVKAQDCMRKGREDINWVKEAPGITEHHLPVYMATCSSISLYVYNGRERENDGVKWSGQLTGGAGEAI